MTRMIWLVAISGLWAGCTTLGPMPTTTGLAAVPSARPGFEVQGGIVPGYLLSEATQKPTHKGNPTPQALVVAEPGEWLGLGGLVVGARTWGQEGDVAIEPVIGYRHQLDDHFAIALVGYGGKMTGAERSASYRANRLGGELAIDARMLRVASWLAIHGQAAVSTTYLDAHGRYCVDSAGLGVDCDDDSNDHMIDGVVRGAFTAGTASLALDFGRSSFGTFHVVRVAVLGSAGVMPQVRDGTQRDVARYASLGLALTLGFGRY